MSKRTKKILKARKKMNKAVSAELVPFGIRKAKYTGEYSYSFKKNRVDYKVTNTAIEDKWFDEFVKERFRYDVFSDFIISILHEIGHAKANENITDDIYEFCMAEKARIGVEMMVAETEEEGRALSFQYFNLPDEIMATQWAVNYAENHENELKEMDERIQPYFKKYLKVTNSRG